MQVIRDISEVGRSMGGSIFVRSSMTILLTVLLGFACLCQETPKTMTKITTRLISPKSAPGSFSGQAKTCWRAGTKYARVAEALDSHNHIHELVVVHEPDVWIINLFDNSGKHIVDSVPPFDAELPIFDMPEGSKAKLNKLEFGREMDFVVKNGARLSPGGSFQGKPTARYDLTVDGYKLTLWTNIKTKVPVRISLADGRQTQTIEYLAYDDGLSFDPSLFRPPAGITLTESK